MGQGSVCPTGTGTWTKPHDQEVDKSVEREILAKGIQRVIWGTLPYVIF